MNKRQLNKVLAEVLRALGPYSKEVVIGGGVALLIYRYYLPLKGSKFSIPATTDDLDLLVPRTLKYRLSESLSTRLERAGFERMTHSIESLPVESYHATINKQEIDLEFLTNRRSRGDQNANVIVGGISAQPLSFIEMSQEHSIKFATPTGVTGLVVMPGSWIFHKALTFPRRRSLNKQAKDLYGIWYAGSQLSDISIQALGDLLELADTYPKSWAQRARKQLYEWVSAASPRDWDRLESQDPAHRLTRALFRKFIEEDFPL